MIRQVQKRFVESRGEATQSCFYQRAPSQGRSRVQLKVKKCFVKGPCAISASGARWRPQMRELLATAIVDIKPLREASSREFEREWAQKGTGETRASTSTHLARSRHAWSSCGVSQHTCTFRIASICSDTAPALRPPQRICAAPCDHSHTSLLQQQ